jgi:type IV pilus modification protein PilV
MIGLKSIKFTNNWILTSKSGYSILEVLIALAIFAIGILGVATMQISATNGNASARMFTEASELTQSQAEALLLQDYATLADGNSVSADGYTTQWTVTPLASGNGFEITVQTSAPQDGAGATPRASITLKRFTDN